MRRVVVTGLGAVTPLGNDVRSTWRAAVGGESGIDWIRAFDASELPVRIAAEVKDWDPTGVASPKEVRKLERNVLLSLGAAREAVADAGLDSVYDAERVGVLHGTAIGGFIGMMQQAEVMRERGPERVTPTFIPSVLVDAASGQLAISLGFRGPNYAPVSACATGSHAIGEAAELIRRGDADAVLAGGAEACIHPLIYAGFSAMRGLVSEEESPPRASRPFDATRAGFVVGEGAGGDRPLVSGGGRDRGDHVRAGGVRRRAAADGELRAPGSRVRSGLRAEQGAGDARRRCALERDGPRRPQRLRASRPRRLAAASIRRASGSSRPPAQVSLRPAGTPGSVLRSRASRLPWPSGCP